MGSQIPGCNACTRNEQTDEMAQDDKEVAKRQKNKNKIEKLVKGSARPKDNDELLSVSSIKGLDNSNSTQDKSESNKDKEKEKKKGFDKNTAKILRVIYKANNAKRIQKAFREFKRRKQLNYKKLNEITFPSNNPQNNKNLSVINEESLVRDEYNDIKLKTGTKMEKSTKNTVSAMNAINTQNTIKSVTYNESLDRIDKQERQDREKDKQGKTRAVSANANSFTNSYSNNNSNNNSKLGFDNEEKKDPQTSTRKKTDYYYSHKKSENKSESKYRMPLEERERVIPGGKFDMISIKADSIQGEKTTQSAFYFSNKGGGGKVDYRQTINSLKEYDKNESGINRVNKSLLWDSPLEDKMLIDLNSNIKSKKEKGNFVKQIYEDGTTYLGYYTKENNKLVPDELGKILHSGGEEYCGQIKKGRITGFGSFNNNNTAMFLGEWKEEYQKGYGVETFTDGSSFSGLIDNGKKMIGTYYWKDGSYFEGEFVDNNFNGFGKYYFTDGRIYSGEWSNGILTGYCEMTSKEGKIYYGFAKNDKKEGFGVYYTPNPKKIFVGFWKGNKQEGVGKLITEKSTKYGFWSQGERLNWYDSFNQAYSHLRNDQLNFAKLLQIEGKEVNRYISQISII